MIRGLFFAALAALLIMLAQTSVYAQDTCEAGTRQVEHVMGVACVPENPQRVVALEWRFVENLLALGIQPVAVADINGYHRWVKIPLELSADTVDIGTRNEPNLEAIAALNPDLIIGVAFRLTENYDDLSAIAPTLVFDPYPADLSSQYDEMLTSFRQMAAAVNREVEAEAVLAHMDMHFAEARNALESAGRLGESFILSQGWVTDGTATFRLFTDNAMAVQFLERIGLANAWADAPQLYGYTEVGIEGFAELNEKTFNFFYVAQNEANDEFAASPLWSSLKFVQDEQAYWLGGDVWMFGGPLSAEVLVDTVLQAMGVEWTTATVQCEAGLRAVQDAAGVSVCVPENPERIVALMESDLDALLALGIIPLGTTNGRGQPTAPRYLGELIMDVEIVGNFYSPNLENVLALDPDLILMGGFTDEAVLEQLKAIAPTINTFVLGETWQSHFTRVAEVVNKQAEAAEFLAAYAARVKELKAMLGDTAGAEVNIVRWNADGPGIMLPNSFASRVLADVGLARPNGLEGEGVGHTPPLSLEDLKQIDADWIFIGTLAEQGDAVDIMAEVVKTPLFQQLNAVQNDQIVFIDGSLWTSIGGPLAALKVLDDVEAAMVG